MPGDDIGIEGPLSRGVKLMWVEDFQFSFDSRHGQLTWLLVDLFEFNSGPFHNDVLTVFIV